ncbi:MAG TPA: TadE/TadG family type IV pilus assembly protein [Candidatus Dormibacteraeota bacterium]|nr:TadE/TadG family type IV pilus assembly protein [Candidatus Dormibacteraeota bacterium]
MSNRPTRARRRGRRGGQALVEFAIIAPLLLVLVCGGAQVAVVVYSQIAVTTASREAARTAADNPKDSGLFPAPVTSGKDCSSTDTRRACVAAYKSTTNTFGLVNPTNFTVTLKSAQYPSGSSTTTCSGTSGTADDGLVTVTVSYQAPVFLPFIGTFFADSGKSYRTVSNTVAQRVDPCVINGGN